MYYPSGIVIRFDRPDSEVARRLIHSWTKTSRRATPPKQFTAFIRMTSPIRISRFSSPARMVRLLDAAPPLSGARRWRGQTHLRLPEFRGRGIARRLLALESTARERGYRPCGLRPARANLRRLVATNRLATVRFRASVSMSRIRSASCFEKRLALGAIWDTASSQETGEGIG